MRIVNIHGVQDVRLDEYKPDTPGERDVLIKVRACGVCGSDLSYIKMGGLRPGEPTPLGHEASGEIVSVGTEVLGLAPGQHVVINPMEGVGLIGNGGTEGAFTEQLLVREAKLNGNVFVVAEDLPFDITALTEPLAVSLHSVHQAKLQPDEKVAVFGCGPIGLGIILWLVERGFDDVVALDIATERLERARNLGARHVINPTTEDVHAKLSEYHGKGSLFGMDMAGTDVFMDAAGAPNLINDIVNLSKPGARMVMTAVHMKPVEVNFSAMLVREFSITPSMGYPTEIPEVLSILPSIRDKAAAMISHRYDFDDVLNAIATAGTPHSAKVMVEFSHN